MKPTILILEDDEAMSMLMQVLLNKQYNVVCKKDGLSGMKWLSEGNMPNVILCDFILPKMNGFDLMSSLGKSGAFSEIPIIIMSARTDDFFKKQCNEAGAFGFLEKPFDPPQLKEILLKALAAEKTHKN